MSVTEIGTQIRRRGVGRQSCKHMITLNCDNVLVEKLTKRSGNTGKSMNELSGEVGELRLINLEKDIS